MSEFNETRGMGWLPEFPDIRDYSADHGDIKGMISSLKLSKPKKSSIHGSADLRQWCSPIENQGSLGSCTANAGVGMIEYYERRAFGEHVDASRLFLYKVTRKLLNWTGDTGAFLRSTMGAMALFGAPPEKYWPYVIADFDKDPDAFCYSFAQDYKSIRYFRLDPPGTAKAALLSTIKAYISAGLPSMFGFTVYNSISQAGSTGGIPFPAGGDKVAGGHAIMVVGYDDAKKISNSNSSGKTTGAFLIRNSWGTGWGDKGYGWLPYQYVTSGLAIDWWTLLRQDYIRTKQFGL